MGTEAKKEVKVIGGIRKFKAKTDGSYVELLHAIPGSLKGDIVFMGNDTIKAYGSDIVTKVDEKKAQAFIDKKNGKKAKKEEK